MSFEPREWTQDVFRTCCFSSSLGSPDRRWPGSFRGLDSTVRAGGCNTQTGFAASAGAERHVYAPQPDERPLAKLDDRGLKIGHGVWDLVIKGSE